MSTILKTTIDILRHGEPVGGKKYRGQIDDALSERGWQQMHDAVGDDCPWDIVVSSSLCRCLAFAEQFAARHGRPLEVEPRLKEVRFGVWEGQTAQQLDDAAPGQVRRFVNDPVGNRPAGAEPLEEFQARVVSAWNNIVERHVGRRVLVVAHAGVIRAVICHVLQVPSAAMYRIQVPSAGITRVQLDHFPEFVLPKLVFHAGSLI